jgi:hypothetical protein
MAIRYQAPLRKATPLVCLARHSVQTRNPGALRLSALNLKHLISKKRQQQSLNARQIVATWPRFRTCWTAQYGLTAFDAAQLCALRTEVPIVMTTYHRLRPPGIIFSWPITYRTNRFETPKNLVRSKSKIYLRVCVFSFWLAVMNLMP